MNISVDYEDNFSLYDTSKRNKLFKLPEQLALGNELAKIAYQRNGKINEAKNEVQDFLNQNQNQK